jgi:CBS domain-containing protein
LLENKGYQVWTIGPDRTVFEALERLAEKDIGALLVMEEKELAGIFSERDHARRVDLEGRKCRETTVGEVMTTEVITVTPEQSIDECMGLMTDRQIRHLPVVENDEVIGVISIGDVVKEVIAEQEFRIEQLQNFIKGDR